MSTSVSTRLLDRRARFAANRHRRRRTVVLAAIVASAATAGAWWTLTGPVFQVRHVSISGYQQADQAEVVSAIQVGAATGDGLHLPVQRIRAAVADAPWVENVSVSHNWPNGVDVRVTTARPVAIAVTSGGDRWIVSSQGRVLDLVSEGAPELPLMVLPAAARGDWLKGATVMAPVRLAAALSPDIRGAVRDLQVRDGVLVGRLATTGTELRFGQLSDLWRKGRALDAILAAPTTQKTLTQTEYIDFSNAERPVFGGLPESVTQVSTSSRTSESTSGETSTGG